MLYVIACAAPPAAAVGRLVSLAQQRGWDVCVLTTPSARRFTDAAALERQTGHPVRSEYKDPGEPDVLPDPDAVIVAPATVNTINKWAAGICDDLALGILVEAIGKQLPIVALPSTNQAHAAHPAFTENIRKLRSWGVSVLFGPGSTRRVSPRRTGTGRTSSPGPRPLTPSAGPGPARRVPQTADRPAPLKETAASLGAAWVAFGARNRPRSARPWTSCRGLWRSWSTTRGGNTAFGRAGPGRRRPGRTGGCRASQPRRHLLSAVLMTADVAAAVTFLASPAAGHITGQIIHVNGGAYLGR